jgi:putative hydrolase of the HAD superfamily
VISTVIFDVGGPLDLETQLEDAFDTDIRAGLQNEGFAFTEGDWERANSWAIDTCAPSVYRSVIWQLTRGDLPASLRIYDWMQERAAPRDLFDLRPGIAEVLRALKDRGIKLGLAANQPAKVLDQLGRHGIGHYFDNQGISGIYGLRKPDVRLFVRVCEELSVDPLECIMVGDRIDNDIVPAKLLGMSTVLIRTGRHRLQQPRSWDERPDLEVVDSAGIRSAVESLIMLRRGE